MASVIQMPLIQIEADLCSIQGLLDAMLFMHEAAEEADRKRIMDSEIDILHAARDRAASALAAYNRVYKAENRRASA